MAFDPEKVVRWAHESGEWVSASDYDALLDLYRKLAVSESNLKFLRTDDDDIQEIQAHKIQDQAHTIEEQAETIKRLESAPWNRGDTK